MSPFLKYTFFFQSTYKYFILYSVYFGSPSFSDSWGPWKQWSVCSVSCGEGVRERMRECLLPSGVQGKQCTGMVKEQSFCSLEDCAGQSLILAYCPDKVNNAAKHVQHVCHLSVSIIKGDP